MMLVGMAETSNLSARPTVSCATGKVMPISAAKSASTSAASVGSMDRAMISTRSEYCLYASSMKGNSFRQGPHQVAQMLIRTASFSWSTSERVTVLPS